MLGCVLMSVIGRGTRGSVEHWIVSVDLPQTQVSPLPQQVEDLAASVAIIEMRVVRWRDRVDGCLVDRFVEAIESQKVKVDLVCVDVRWSLQVECRRDLRRQANVFISDCHDKQWPCRWPVGGMFCRDLTRPWAHSTQS